MNHMQGLGNALNIFSNQDVAATTATQAANGGQVTSAAASLAAAFTGDQARLSAAGSQVSPVEESDVRLDKVASLQSQIATGTYNVSSSDVAGKIVDALLN